METIAILFMLILANLIYIALSCYYKTKKEDLVKMHPLIFEGLVSSFLFYIAFIIYVITNIHFLLVIGMAISAIIAQICSWFLRKNGQTIVFSKVSAVRRRRRCRFQAHVLPLRRFHCFQASERFLQLAFLLPVPAPFPSPYLKESN